MVVFTSKQQVAECSALGAAVVTMAEKYDDPAWIRNKEELLNYFSSQLGYYNPEDCLKDNVQQPLYRLRSPIYHREQAAGIRGLFEVRLSLTSEVEVFDFIDIEGNSLFGSADLELRSEFHASETFPSLVQALQDKVDEALLYFNIQIFAWLLGQRFIEGESVPSFLEGVTGEMVKTWQVPIEGFGYGRGKRLLQGVLLNEMLAIANDTSVSEELRRAFLLTPRQVLMIGNILVNGARPGPDEWPGEGWGELPPKVEPKDPDGYTVGGSGILIPNTVKL